MLSANERAAVHAALAAAGIGQSIAGARDLSGGCIHRVLRLDLADGRMLAVKINRADALPIFEEEATGLRSLAETRTVIVPQPLAHIAHASSALLLMSFIEDPDRRQGDRMWQRFGEDLAALHSAPLSDKLARGYGFVIDNHLGSTPQPNGWCDDWVRFNAERRLGHQVRLARERGVLSAPQARMIESVIERLDRFLPRQPRPSLLHGDLWSGNALPARVGVVSSQSDAATCAVIDPAPYVGDALADIAMMCLFGGFSESCFSAWSDRMAIDLDDDEVQSRIATYQLYHLLNHVNIFGEGYIGQAMSLAQRLS